MRLSPSYLFLLLVCLILPGCFTRAVPLTPSVDPPPHAGDPVPLDTALVLTPEFEDLVFETGHASPSAAGCVSDGRPCEPTPLGLRITIRVGESSAELFQEGMAQVFTGVRVVQSKAEAQWTDLMLVPRIRTSEPNAASRGVRIQLAYDLELVTQQGTSSAISSGLVTRGYQTRLSVADLFLWPAYLVDWFLAGAANMTARHYAVAFAEAQEEAYQRLVARLRDAPILAQALTEAERVRVAAQLSPSERDMDASLDRLATGLLEGLAGEPDRLIAVTSFTPLDGELTRFEPFLREELLVRLAGANGPHTVVARGMLEKALEELELQQADLVDPRHAKAVGRIMGADAVLVGTTSDVGHWIRVQARILDTERGEVIAAAGVRLFKTEQVLHLRK